MTTALWVFVAGGIGAALRGILCLLWQSSFPWAVFSINAAGSFAAGCVVVWQLPGPLSVVLLVGFCGGFTTYSSLALDSVILGEGCLRRGLVNLFLNLAGGWLGVFFGGAIGFWLQSL